LVRALLDSHFEQPAVIEQAILANPPSLQIFIIPHQSMGCYLSKVSLLKTLI